MSSRSNQIAIESSHRIIKARESMIGWHTKQKHKRLARIEWTPTPIEMKNTTQANTEPNQF